MRKFLLITTVSVFLGGCSTVGEWFSGTESKVEPPRELTELSSSIPVRTLWSADVGAGVEDEFFKLAPALDQGNVFAAGRDGRVSAFQGGSGSVLWSVDLDLPISGGVGAGGGLVLVGSDNADLVALSARDGSELWRTKTSSEILSSPVIEQGVAVVRTVDGNVTGYEIATGGRTWRYPRRVPALTLRGVSAPVLVEDHVLSASDSGKLTLLTLDTGRPLWEKNIAAPQGRTELERIVDIDGDPVVVGNKVYVVSFQGKAAALQISSGNATWARDMSSYVGLDADRDQVYVTDDSSDVWGLDASSGETLWKQTDFHRRDLTRPVEAGSHVVVGDFEGYVHWLSKADGSAVARTRLSDSGVLASPVADGNIVYILDRGGRLSALSASR